MDRQQRIDLMTHALQRLVRAFAENVEGPFAIFSDKATPDYVQFALLDYADDESHHSTLPVSKDVKMPKTAFEVTARGLAYLESGEAAKNPLTPQQVSAITRRGFEMGTFPNYRCMIDLADPRRIAVRVQK